MCGDVYVRKVRSLTHARTRSRAARLTARPRRSPETRGPFECKGLRKARDALPADKRYSGGPGGGNRFTTPRRGNEPPRDIPCLVKEGETERERESANRSANAFTKATRTLLGTSRREVGRVFGQDPFLERTTGRPVIIAIQDRGSRRAQTSSSSGSSSPRGKSTRNLRATIPTERALILLVLFLTNNVFRLNSEKKLCTVSRPSRC